MQRPLTIFLCSTFQDLSAEREAVLEAVRTLQLQHDSMEFFGARPNEPLETCLEEVRRSDILVVIVGHRYGAIAPETSISYSEAEYNEAIRLAKPCLVYVKDDSAPVLISQIERDPDKSRQLSTWKQVLATRHTIAPFTNAQALALQVSADLGRSIATLNTVADARAAAVNTNQSAALTRSRIEALLADALRDGLDESDLLSTIRIAVHGLLERKSKRPPTVFLSYARTDRDTVERVAHQLSDAGVDVWFDLDSISLGSNWVEEIERGLDTADCIIIFVSPGMMASTWTQRELSVALSRQVSGNGVKIIPVLIGDAEMPPLLRTQQYLDLRDGDIEGAVKRLLRVIRSVESK